MFNLPDKYKVNKKIPIKDFISKTLKPDERKMIKDIVKSVVLSYQIMGEDIPSVIDDETNCQVIQFYTFEIADIKKANKISAIYQELIKPFCIIKFVDSKNEAYSLAIKRLNKNDSTQIVVEESLLSQIYPILAIKKAFERNLDFTTIKNTTNKYNFYYEIFLKAYIITNNKIYSNVKRFLNMPIWYDIIKVKELYELLSNLELKKEQVKRSISNSEKMRLNQEIRLLIDRLNKI